MTDPKPAPRKRITPAKPSTPAKKPATPRTRVTTTPRPVGRPNRQTPERMSRILNAIALGIPVTVASSTSGVPYSTHKTWIRNGEQEVERLRVKHPDVEVEVIEWCETRGLGDSYPATAPLWTAAPPRWANRDTWHAAVFVVLVQHARDRAEASALSTIRRAAKDDWKAAAWFLERTRSKDYGRTDRMQHEGVPGGAPIAVTAVPPPEAVLDRVRALAEERKQIAAAPSVDDDL